MNIMEYSNDYFNWDEIIEFYEQENWPQEFINDLKKQRDEKQLEATRTYDQL